MSDRIEVQFREFHAENPHVYAELKSLALQLIARGRSYYSIDALFQVLRYHRALTTTDPDYKLNNNYRALYARLLMENEPELEDFFAIRHRVAA